MIDKKLKSNKIVLGVTGGIAAYKSADLVRRLREAGAEVRVVMTRAAQAFVTPLTFQAVSGHPVRSTLLDPEAESGMSHIELARWAEQVVVAPATADFLAKLAHGLADDLLSTLCLATEAPVMLAPAMNRVMWLNIATQANCNTLRKRGVRLLGPAEGDQACGETGPGRMVEPATIVAALAGEGILQGVSLMVTAGPTYEAIDPVRFIGNRSSGRMGFATALAAYNQGADVTLVTGPVNQPTPPGVKRIDVRTAEEMHSAVMYSIDNTDIFIGAAAVADYTPRVVAEIKLKKQSEEMTLELVRTTDILQQVAALKSPPFTVGFAAETSNLKEYARKKLQDKKLDMIAANRVGQTDTGFEAEENELLMMTPDGQQRIGRAGKHQVAVELIELIAAEYKKKRGD